MCTSQLAAENLRGLETSTSDLRARGGLGLGLDRGTRRRGSAPIWLRLISAQPAGARAPRGGHFGGSRGPFPFPQAFLILSRQIPRGVFGQEVLSLSSAFPQPFLADRTMALPSRGSSTFPQPFLGLASQIARRLFHSGVLSTFPQPSVSLAS